MNSSNPAINKPAWVQLYEARRVSVEYEPRSPGRPPAPIPRRKVGFTLTQGELRELEVWQERFSRLLRRKVSLGEAIGILTRISTARAARLLEAAEPATLADLVERMIGED
jgi:hypothetical protein